MFPGQRLVRDSLASAGVRASPVQRARRSADRAVTCTLVLVIARSLHAFVKCVLRECPRQDSNLLVAA